MLGTKGSKGLIPAARGPLFGVALLFCSAIAGQTLSLTASSFNVPAGQQVAITVSYTDPMPSAGVAALQWNLQAPAGLAALSWQAGGAGTAAGKLINCNGSLCVLAGTNTTVIGSGAVGSAIFQVPSTQPAGALTFSLTGGLGATPAGLMVSVGSIGPISLSVPPASIQVPLQLLAGSGADPRAITCTPYTDANLPAIYKTLCYGATVHFRIPLQPGSYTGSLVFVEPNRTAVGQRIMTVAIDGQTSDPIDVFEAVGIDKPFVFPWFAHVNAGVLDIQVTGLVGNAVLSAIQVQQYFAGAF